jgi:hypothetical protein
MNPPDGSTNDSTPSRDGASADAKHDAHDERDAPREATVTDGVPPREHAPTCSDGAPIAYSRTRCPGTPPAVPGGLVSAASVATRGDVLSLDGIAEPSSPCAPVNVCVPTDAPVLVFSDDPESPASDGVLYADVIGPGRYRAYVYHTNGGSGLRKFPAVLLNQGASPVHANVGPTGIAGPSSDYVEVGKQAVSAWLTSAKTTSLVVPPGERALLDADLDAVHAGPGDLAHGIVDFSLDGPVKISVVSVPSTADATVVTAGLSLLSSDGMHVRGSFPGAAIELESSAPMDGAGVRHIDLGGNVTDLTLTGHDYVDGTTVALAGDYGVPYAIRFVLATNAALVVAPQGGPWGGVARLPAGLDAPPGVTLLPASADSLGSQTEAIFAGRYSATPVSLVLMSAGGSNLPIDVAALPLP